MIREGYVRKQFLDIARGSARERVCSIALIAGVLSFVSGCCRVKTVDGVGKSEATSPDSSYSLEYRVPTTWRRSRGKSGESTVYVASRDRVGTDVGTLTVAIRPVVPGMTVEVAEDNVRRSAVVNGLRIVPFVEGQYGTGGGGDGSRLLSYIVQTPDDDRYWVSFEGSAQVIEQEWDALGEFLVSLRWAGASAKVQRRGEGK